MNKQLFRTMIVILSLLGAVQVLNAQQNNLNTVMYDSIAGSPNATLNQVEWIKGYWKGKAMGGTTEEVWTDPTGGSMVGTFKLIVNGKVQFYELMTIVEENKTLLLRLKHFHSNSQN